MTFQSLLFTFFPVLAHQDGDEIYFSWFIRKSCYSAAPVGSH